MLSIIFIEDIDKYMDNLSTPSIKIIESIDKNTVRSADNMPNARCQQLISRTFSLVETVQAIKPAINYGTKPRPSASIELRLALSTAFRLCFHSWSRIPFPAVVASIFVWCVQLQVFPVNVPVFVQDQMQLR